MYRTSSSFLKGIAALTCLLGILCPYLLSHFSLNFADEPYQILNAFEYEKNPQAPLTSCISTIWGGVFGWSLISFRYLAATISNITLILGGGYLYKHCRKINLTLFTVGFSAFLLSLVQQKSYLYGWDIFSNLFIVCNLIILLSFYKRESIKKLILLSLFTSCAILCRIPNVVILPIIAFLIFISTNVRTLRHILTYLLFSIVFIFLWVVLLYGNLSEFISSIEANKIDSHSINAIFNYYIHDLIRNIKTYSMCGSVFIAIWLTKYFKTRRPTTALIFLIGFLTMFYPLFIVRATDAYNGGINSYLSALFLIFLTYLLIKSEDLSKIHKQHLRLVLLTLAIFSFIPTMGSNTGVFKALNASIYPLLIAIGYKYAGYSIRFFSIIIIGCIMLYAPLNKRIVLFQDKGVAFTTCKLTHPDLKRIWTTPKNSEYISKSLTLVQKHLSDNQHILILGDDANRFMFEYLLRSRTKFSRHMWSEHLLDNTDYIKEVEKYLKTDCNPTQTSILVVKRNDGIKSLTEETLNRFNWKLVDGTDRISIYMYSNDTITQ